MMLAPCVYLHYGFARGHYVRRSPRVKVARVTVGPRCRIGWSLQLHTKAGVRYLDLIVWRWATWREHVKGKRTRV